MQPREQCLAWFRAFHTVSAPSTRRIGLVFVFPSYNKYVWPRCGVLIDSFWSDFSLSIFLSWHERKCAPHPHHALQANREHGARCPVLLTPLPRCALPAPRSAADVRRLCVFGPFRLQARAVREPA